MIEILHQILLRSQCCEVVALCCVVGTTGSTPQAVGAAMLVLRDGKTLGTLGGGCVEADVRVQAQRLMDQSQTRLLRFRLDRDYGWDDGLVCGGTMDIAVRIISSPDDAAFAQSILDDLKAEQTARCFFDTIDENQKAARFEIPIPPMPRLVIAGAGHVGYSLAKVAALLDFRVTVIDDRADFAVASRFATATCVVGDIANELRRYSKSKAYFVIVTRGHRNDAIALEAVMDSNAEYIGLIGSKRKISQIVRQLHEKGVPAGNLARIHAPIGLDIGAVTPEEIAVSIASELIAIRRGRGDRPAPPMKMSADQFLRLFKPR